jgi:hypothetical protein
MAAALAALWHRACGLAGLRAKIHVIMAGVAWKTARKPGSGC